MLFSNGFDSSGISCCFNDVVLSIRLFNTLGYNCAILRNVLKLQTSILVVEWLICLNKYFSRY